MSSYNQSIPHDFFYSGFNHYRRIKSCHIWYSNNCIQSYSTTVGLVVTDKRDKKVTLLSRDNMSVTTGRHLEYIRQANPYDRLSVALSYDEKLCYMSAKEQLHAISNNFEIALNYAKKNKLSLVKNRNEFISLFDDARKFSNCVYTLSFLDKYETTYNRCKNDVSGLKREQREKDKAQRENDLKQFNHMIDRGATLSDFKSYQWRKDYFGKLCKNKVIELEKIESDKLLAQLKNPSIDELKTLRSTHFTNSTFRTIVEDLIRNEEKRLAVEKFENLRTSLSDDEFLKLSLYDLSYDIRQLISNEQERLLNIEKEKEFKELAKNGLTLTLIEKCNSQWRGFMRNRFNEEFNASENLSFVWFDHEMDVFRTSKGVTMTKEKGLFALKLFKNNELKRDMKIDIYTVLSITSDFVKIGCHTIPTKNLELLCQSFEIE